MKKKWTGERLEPGIHSQVTAEHLHRYALAMEFAKEKNVLDIACGEGYGSNLLAGIAAHVTGVDIDETTISEAQEKYRKANLSFSKGTVEDIPVPNNCFDLVTSFETLEHTSAHNQFLSGIKSVLKKDGLLILSTPDRKWYTDKTGYHNPFHIKELYREEFESLLRKYFSNVTIVYQKFICASMVLADSDKLLFYSGSFDAISKQEAPEAVYMIAFASDAPIPPINQSFFNLPDIMDKALRQKEKDIKQSMSYRLGNFLLAPAKWLKKLLKKV